MCRLVQHCALLCCLFWALHSMFSVVHSSHRCTTTRFSTFFVLRWCYFVSSSSKQKWFKLCALWDVMKALGNSCTEMFPSLQSTFFLLFLTRDVTLMLPLNHVLHLKLNWTSLMSSQDSSVNENLKFKTHFEDAWLYTTTDSKVQYAK